MKSRLLILMVLSIILPLAAMTAKAQDYVDSYRFDLGGSLGMSGYLGDANESNMFKHPGFAANIQGRYLIDPRWAVRAQFGVQSISGNTADFDNKLPDGAQFKFNSTVYDLGVRGEANFFAYGVGETYKRLRRWTPFVAVGVGVSMASTDSGTYAAFNIPLSLGVKYKFSPRWNLIAEFSMTKAFSDKIDGENLSDPLGIKSSFLKNTDWYSSLTVGVTYEFGARCATCHRID